MLVLPLQTKLNFNEASGNAVSTRVVLEIFWACDRMIEESPSFDCFFIQQKRTNTFTYIQWTSTEWYEKELDRKSIHKVQVESRNVDDRPSFMFTICNDLCGNSAMNSSSANVNTKSISIFSVPDNHKRNSSISQIDFLCNALLEIVYNVLYNLTEHKFRNKFHRRVMNLT